MVMKHKCSKCDRAFSMAANLARHVTVVHGRKTSRKLFSKMRAKAGARYKLSRSKGGAGARRTPDGAAGLLSKMQAYHDQLHAECDSVAAQMDAISSMMEMLGASSPSSGPRPTSTRRAPAPRGGRASLIKPFILKAFRQRSTPMGPSDIATSIRRLGYKSKAKDLAKMVSKKLPDLKEVKKVGRGLYKI